MIGGEIFEVGISSLFPSYPEEKHSRRGGSIPRTQWLLDFVEKFHLKDVDSFGVFYTWTNNRSSDGVTFEKLDRAMGVIPGVALSQKRC